MEREYWVWYGEQGAEQGRVVAKFSDEDMCKGWCEDVLGGYVEIGRSFPMRRWTDEGPQIAGNGVIGVVEDHTSD